MNIVEIPGLLFRKIFGSRNDRLLKRYGAVADVTLTFEDELRALSLEQLRAKTDELKKRFVPQASIDTVKETIEWAKARNPLAPKS